VEIQAPGDRLLRPPEGRRLRPRHQCRAGRRAERPRTMELRHHWSMGDLRERL